MKRLVMLVLFAFGMISALFSEEIVIFKSSPSSKSYDASWGKYKEPSVLLLMGEKLPVDDTIALTGINSVIYRWTSRTNGDWRGALAQMGWTVHDLSEFDNITFWVYSKVDLVTNDMPLVFIEDTKDRKSPRLKMSDYISNIAPNTWTKVVIPLAPFKTLPHTNDLTQIKTFFLGQNEPDEKEHIIYVADARFIKIDKNANKNAPAVPTGVYTTAYDQHIDIFWKPNAEKDLDGYNVYKKIGSNYQRIGVVAKDESIYSDFVGSNDVECIYKITAVNSAGLESDFSPEMKDTTSVEPYSDEQLLDMVQEASFRYFWNYAHPVSGMTREKTASRDTVTTGGTGMGIMSILVGIERKYITKDQGLDRILQITRFLDKAQRYHGAWSHWMNGVTADSIPFSRYDDAADLPETAYMIVALLTAKEYFKGKSKKEKELRSTVDRFWKEVEWDWFRKTTNSIYLYWHWSPEHDWKMNLPIQGPNEAMITYLLAIASPTHSVPIDLYYLGWKGNADYKKTRNYFGIPMHSNIKNGGPLFFAHYSFLGFDPRNLWDTNGINYFEENQNHSLIHYHYAVTNKKGFPGYGADCWGLTASNDPFGYLAHEPSPNFDNGTVAPTAAVSSMPYTPTESLQALKGFYYKYGKKLWGPYGFRDAFNVKEDWYDGTYVAIDQGPQVIMIENYRSGLLWKLFMANPDFQKMLKKTGFSNNKPK